MKLSIIKCLSIFVASEQSQKCNQLKAALREHLYASDPETGLSKAWLHKFGREDFRKDQQRVDKEVAKIVLPFMRGIPDHFYGPDKGVDRASQN